MGPKKKRKRKKKKKNKEILQEKEENVNDDENVDDNECKEDQTQSIEKKQSIKEWQVQHTENVTIKPSKVITAVNTSHSLPIRLRIGGPIPPKKIGGSIQSKLSSIKINMNGNYDGQNADDQVFRIQSPSDYHTSFKWNDVTKDRESELIEKLEHDENEKKKNNQFPDPLSYEQKEKELFEQIDNEQITMNDQELEQEISSLIQTVPNDDEQNGLSLSSEEEEEEEFMT